MLPFLRRKFQREEIWCVSYENKRTVFLVLSITCVRMELSDGSLHLKKGDYNEVCREIEKG